MLHWTHDLHAPSAPGLYSVVSIGVIEVSAQDIEAARSAGGDIWFDVWTAVHIDPSQPLTYRLRELEAAPATPPAVTL